MKIKYNFKVPSGINTDKNNIFEIHPPYCLLYEGPKQDFEAKQKDWVLFWGAPFINFPSVYSDVPGFIEKTNLCLDFVRRECSGYKLFYKLHPSETVEPSLLNLDNFTLLKEKTVSEFFIMKNFNKIKYSLSAYSSASMMAHKLGLNSYIFLPLVESTMTPLNREGNRAYFKNMFPEFFIKSWDQKLLENKSNMSKIPDPILSRNFSEILSENKGKAWFIVGDPGSLILAISLMRLIKSLAPQRKVGLIVERHHRWEVMNMGEVAGYFDAILTYPRWVASLRPRKIWGRIKTAISIRKAPVFPGDILIGLNFDSFTENCFISYFPKNFKMAFFKKDVLEFCYGPKDPSFFKTYFTRTGIIFNTKILEPLLGLNRVVFFEDPARVSNYDRYLKPVNDLYDQVYSY